jgi:hypothetical protein
MQKKNLAAIVLVFLPLLLGASLPLLRNGFGVRSAPAFRIDVGMVFVAGVFLTLLWRS